MLDSLHLIEMVFTMIRMLMITIVKELTTPWLATMLATLATTSLPALLLLPLSVVGEGKKNRGEDDLGPPTMMLSSNKQIRL